MHVYKFPEILLGVKIHSKQLISEHAIGNGRYTMCTTHSAPFGKSITRINAYQNMLLGHTDLDGAG